MNKKEAIEKIKKLEGLTILDKTINLDSEMISKGEALEIVNQLDEPQKPVVPKFVADLVDNSREYSFDFDEWFDYENQLSKVYYWLNPENKRQAELNALALITLIVNGANAVEVEQEKLYTVEIPNPNCPDIATFLYKENGKIFIGTDIFLDEVPNYKWKNEPENQLTEAEIKKDFEWAWQFAEEVEEC